MSTKTRPLKFIKNAKIQIKKLGIELDKKMKIFVKAKPKAREDKLEDLGGNTFKISVKEPPEKGRANQAIAKALSEYFKTPFYRISLVSGFSSRDKIFEIENL